MLRTHEAQVGNGQAREDARKYRLQHHGLAQQNKHLPQSTEEERPDEEPAHALQHGVMPIGGQRLVGGVSQAKEEDRAPDRERVIGGGDQRGRPASDGPDGHYSPAKTWKSAPRTVAT